LPMKKAEPQKIVVSLSNNNGNNATPADAISSLPTSEKTTEPVINSLDLKLVDKNEATAFNPQPAFPAPQPENDWRFQLDNPTAQEETKEPELSFSAPEDFKEKLNQIQLVIKNEEDNNDEFKIGEHYLSEDEIADKKAFEEQKKALEDRAERLRRMSFNIKGSEANDEMENVPAYVRKNLNIDNGVASADTFYSKYSIGVNDDKENNQASIQTINTFLDGKKPD